MMLLAVYLYVLLAIQTHKGPVHRPAPPNEAASLRKFVQGFYDWYVPATFNGHGDAELVALKSKAAMFTPELRRALLEDWQASSKSKDEIVGLDFDPFLDSQDPDKQYSVRKVEHKGKNWLASVYGSTSLKEKSGVPSVIAEVEKSGHGWRFTNFLYDGGDDLLKTLRQLKKERER